MADGGGSPIQVTCPCCGSALSIDPGTGAVSEWKEAQDPRKTAELKDARKVLEDESSRIHEKYRQIVEADKGRGAAMDRLFKDFVEKTKDEPPPKPVRDIDLD